jgi:hypothetical protein
MAVIQFESIVEGGIIRIPEQYIDKISTRDRVAVTLVDVPKLKTQKELPHIDEFPAILDTRGWKFNREDANERR